MKISHESILIDHWKTSILAPLVGALKWVADLVTSTERSILQFPQQNQNLWQNQNQAVVQMEKVHEYWLWLVQYIWSWGLEGPILLQQQWRNYWGLPWIHPLWQKLAFLRSSRTSSWQRKCINYIVLSLAKGMIKKWKSTSSWWWLALLALCYI